MLYIFVVDVVEWQHWILLGLFAKVSERHTDLVRKLQRVPIDFKNCDFDNCVLPVVSAFMAYHPFIDKDRQVSGSLELVTCGPVQYMQCVLAYMQMLVSEGQRVGEMHLYEVLYLSVYLSVRVG